MDRLAEFQRNGAFVGFTLVVCFAASVYITDKLRTVLIPLAWAVFFALPVSGLISKVDHFLVDRYCCIVALVSRRQRILLQPVRFEATSTDNYITLVGTSSQLSILLRMANSVCARRQIRIESLQAPNGFPLGRKVNRLVEGWRYYVGKSEAIDTRAGSDEAVRKRVYLSLDRKGRYPSVVEDAIEPEAPVVLLSGTVSLVRSTTLSWSIAFCLVMFAVAVCAMIWAVLITKGAKAVDDNLAHYQKGINDLGDWFTHYFKPLLPTDIWEALSDRLGSFLKDLVPQLATNIVLGMEEVLWETTLFLIYLFFWVFEPLPINKEIARVFKAYLLLKTSMCFVFAAFMSLILWKLRCPLWPLFFVLTFLLNYIPEIGAIMSALLSVPAVLFNGEIETRQRIVNTLWLVLLGTGAKVICGNVIEVRMYATRGGQFLRMHPVILMAMMMLCSSLLGITGMFLAIPILACIKFYVVAAEMPGSLVDPILQFIEGDAMGPHKNFVEARPCRTCRPPASPPVDNTAAAPATPLLLENGAQASDELPSDCLATPPRQSRV